MFFISKKRFREEVERELSEKIEERQYRMAMDTEVSRLYSRIGLLENRVERLEGEKDCTPDLPY